MVRAVDTTLRDREEDPHAAFWVDAKVMEARIRSAQADPELRRDLIELQPDTLEEL
jgi:hypothetical protein